MNSVIFRQKENTTRELPHWFGEVDACDLSSGSEGKKEYNDNYVLTGIGVSVGI